jgi:formylglycine-generating enzyme required for sulfatase activity
MTASAQTCNPADLNDDGLIDGKDLAIVISAWGACPTVITSVAPLEGSVLGGTELTITGSGLSTVTAVTVGGVPCTNVTVVSTRQIRVTTPPGTVGSAEIVVTGAGGTESAADEFTYMQQTIASIHPPSGYFGGGSLVTVSGGYLAGTTAISFGGVPATSLEVVNATTVRAVTPAGSLGPVDVVVVGGKGTVTVPNGFEYVPLAIPAWATLIEDVPDPAVVHDENLRTSIISTGYSWRVRDAATQIEFVLIPPGTFQMGCSASSEWGCNSVENPVHTVTLTNAIYLARYEVTQAQWTAQMGSNPSRFQAESQEVPASQVPNRPVERVSWNMIQGFLADTGMRLPTEAEWEYAYRAGTTTAFHGFTGHLSGTNDAGLLENIAWFLGNSAGQTRPVGQKAANGLGLHDMSGNAWEWVNDWLGQYSPDPEVDPSGPSSGEYRVLRGGGWLNTNSVAGSRDCRSSSRGYGSPLSDGGIYGGRGFRVARDP